MFYLFHHMPKCGGTSFVDFLRSIFRVHPDYVGADHVQQPERFEAFKRAPRDLTQLKATDCIVGHYNLRGIKLDERYPDLELLPHRKFSILREPIEAAASGIRYGIKQGWLAAETSEDEHVERIFRRANYFANTFGISDPSQVDQVFKKYWFIAPLDRIQHAVKILETETQKIGKPLEIRNQTSRDHRIELPQWAIDDFRNRSELDYMLYDRAQLEFGKFSAAYMQNARAQF